MSINFTHIYSVPYMEHKITSIESAEIYELAPISLWVEDFSAVRKLLEGWREDGITDLGVFFAGRPTTGQTQFCAHSGFKSQS